MQPSNSKVIRRFVFSHCIQCSSDIVQFVQAAHCSSAAGGAVGIREALSAQVVFHQWPAPKEQFQQAQPHGRHIGRLDNVNDVSRQARHLAIDSFDWTDGQIV